MAQVVVLESFGIEPSINKFNYNIQGDPSQGTGLNAATGSIAYQVDSVPNPGQLWQKTTSPATGWTQVVSAGGTGGLSSSGAFRVSQYSVPVDGTTSANAAMTTLYSANVPASGGPYPVIVGPNETVLFTADHTIPATVQIQSTGGTLKPASGKKLTLLAQPVGAGKMFDTSAGGVVLSGRAMTANPLWWGADATGVAGSHAALNAALGYIAADAAPGGGSPTGTWGGRCYIPAGTYLMDDYGKAFGVGYSKLLIEGDGAATVLQTIAGRVQDTAPEWEGVLTFYGGSSFATKKITIRDLSFKGAGTSDATSFISLDQAEDISFENLYFQDNAIEGIRGTSGFQVRKVNMHNCHATNVGRGNRGAAFMNIGAISFTMTDCTVENSSIGLETANSFTTVANCRFKDMTQWGIMLYSTWSGYLDPDNSYAQVNAYGGTVTNCQFINIPDRAILIPDFTGHTNGDGAHPTPAHIDGNIGQIQIANNLFDRVGFSVWGGADKLGAVEMYGNLISGQYDAGTGPQTFALSPMGGAWNIHDNTFQIGKGLQWSGLIGYSYGNRSAARSIFTANTVYDKCWSGNPAFAIYQDDTIGGTRWIDRDGSIAGAPAVEMYRISDPYNTPIAILLVSEWAWWDRNHQLSMGVEPTILPVLGNTLPATFSFKPGDVLINRSPSVNWNQKRCTTGGTRNPVALTCTATGTAGTKTLTISDTTGMMQYGWIYFPALPAIAPKKIMSPMNPGTTTVLTVDVNLEATVPGGTAVSWAAPVFVSDRDINTLAIASQASGDLFYANSTTSLTRLAKGNDGAYLSLASGAPAWVDAPVRYDAGNTASALTVTWTAARQEQKVTCTAATPVITVAGIPSGGYLVLDVFQDATASRNPSFAQSGMGSLVWTNGNVAPTLTATPAGISDRYLFHNDGVRCVGSVTWQNL